MEDTDSAPPLGWLEGQSHTSRSTTVLQLLLQDLIRLMDIDGKMQKIVLDILDLGSVARNPRQKDYEVMASGSLIEGCMLARCFWPNSNIGPELLQQGAHRTSVRCYSDDEERVKAMSNKTRPTEIAVASLLKGLRVDS